jgi:SAM-dependent methyltransferase
VHREQQHWDRLASQDPMWVILTEPDKAGKWDERAFFESGEREISAALALLRERFCLTPRRRTAVDFGCGLGRLTQALATHFEHVHGIDISERMVSEARLRNRYGDRVTYHANVTDELPMLATASVDFVYSRLVLQHVPSHVARRYVTAFGRILAPGGVGFFQTLSRATRWPVRVRHFVRDVIPGPYRWLRDLLRPGAHWEMNVLPEHAVQESLAGTGVRVAHVLDDDAGTAEFESRFFVVVK